MCITDLFKLLGHRYCSQCENRLTSVIICTQCGLESGGIMSDPDFNNLPLSQIASIIVRQLEITFPDENTLDTHNRQVLCLAEEIGEFIQAYRRYSGQARGHGDFDTMCAELADIVIVSHVTARVLGINLDDAIVKKLNRIFERGWHHDKPFEETVPLGDSPNA